VVLDPQHVGRRRALHHAVRILDVLILLAFGRHEIGLHAGRRQLPARAAVARLPDAAARHRDGDMLRVARVDEHRVNAGVVIAAAEPVAAAPIEPERIVQRPAVAAVGRAEQARRQAAGPERSGLVRAARFARFTRLV